MSGVITEGGRLRQRVSQAGGLRQRVTERGSMANAPSLAELGADLLYHYEVPAADSAYISLSGTDVLTLANRTATVAPLTSQSQPANPITYLPTGGPNGTPAIEQSSGTGYLANYDTQFAIALGTRVAFYTVCKAPPATGPSDPSLPVVVYESSSAFTVAGANALVGAPVGFPSMVASPVGALGQNLTAGPSDSEFHVYSVAYLASGCEGRVDGVVISPDFAGTGAAAGTNTIEVCYGGALAFLCVVLSPDAAKDAIVRAYINQRYGL